MNKKEKLAFAVVAALAMTSGGFAFGQSVNNVSSDQVIYACVTGVNGNITKVSNTQKTCPKGTTPISWNMVGPKGDQGIQGVKGDIGIQGPPGIKGNEGAQGIAGTNGQPGYSGPLTYVVDKLNNQFPVFYGPYGAAVQIDGVTYAYTGGQQPDNSAPFMASTALGSHDFFYENSTCDSRPIEVFQSAEAKPIPNLAYSGGYSSQTVTLLKTIDIDATSLNSIRIHSGCYPLDVGYYEAAYSRWNSRVRSAWNHFADYNSNSGWIVASFTDCTIRGSVLIESNANNNRYFRFNDTYSDCNKNGFSNSVTLQVQASYSKEALGIFREGDTLSESFDQNSYSQAESDVNLWLQRWTPTNNSLFSANLIPLLNDPAIQLGWTVIVK